MTQTSSGPKGSDRQLHLQCPVCDGQSGAPIDSAVTVPVMMNRVYGSAQDARNAARATLSLARCQDCGFVWNSRFEPSIMAYDESYENDQTLSSAFVAHLTTRARHVIASVPEAEPIDALEVGCGQGRFLQELASVGGGRLRSLEGFDPAWRGSGPEGPGGARIHRRYFDATSAQQLSHAPNVIVSRHTIEHVADPIAFLRAIRAALGPESQASVFIETPCIEWILQRGAMQDFCYEHCSLFDAPSLATALKRAGFIDARVEHVFGGQYLWAHAQATALPQGLAFTRDDVTLPQIDSARRSFIAHWRQELDKAAQDGPVALWGASTKGVTFALLNDPQAQLIDHVVDINPAKQGRYLALSGLAVLSPADSIQRGPQTIFVMNPNYLEEIRESLAAQGSNPRLVPIN